MKTQNKVQNTGTQEIILSGKKNGMAAMLLILRRNGVQLSYTQEELIALGLAVAQGAADVEEAAAWIQAHRV